MTALTADRRAILLFGTEEKVAPLRRLTAGRLSAEFDRGNVRYVRWGGFEVLRAIAFVIRDTGWGTCDPVLSGLAVEEKVDRFRVRYEAVVSGAEGSFRYRAEIVGSADGALGFHATGTSDTGFATNRTGFVVLHPLKGVVGHDVAVEHASGGASVTKFPELVDPRQPVFDIHALRHEPMPGLAVSIRMEGETFEMEDHRNWTDASFKTYVRPLSLGFPYTIAAGETLDQRVTLAIEGKAPIAPAGTGAATVRVGGGAGTMPPIGLFLASSGTAAAARNASALARLRPSYLVARIDGRGDLAEIPVIAEIAQRIAVPVSVDIVIAGRLPGAEITPVAAALKRASLTPEAVFVAPARDLRGRPADQVPAGESEPAMILAEARRAFPDTRIGGGMPVAFPEFNRNRPAAGVDFVTHATQATCHAADDVSVMETLEALPHVIRSVRAIAGTVPYRLGLASIGMPKETFSAIPAVNPESRRVATAEDEPRQRALFGAAFALGYAAAAAETGVDAITLAACAGPAGVLADDGKPYPVAAVIGGLVELAGRPRLATAVEGGARIAAIAAEGHDGPVLWLVNLGAASEKVRLAGRSFRRYRRIDAEALSKGGALDIPDVPFQGNSVELDSYAICRLS